MKQSTIIPFALSFLIMNGQAAADLVVKPIQVKESEGSVGFEEKDGAKAGFQLTPLITLPEGQKTPLSPVTPGVAVGDVDGDGLTDVFVCGMDRKSALYRNLGDWKFLDITEDSGLTSATNLYTGALMADIDGDNDLDLFAFSLMQQSRLFLNDGKGGFKEDERFPWLTRPFAGDTSGTMADIDGDGDLDLYVTTYINFSVRKDTSPLRYKEFVEPQLERLRKGEEADPGFLQHFEVQEIPGKPGEYNVRQRGAEDAIYFNNGDGTFTALPEGKTIFFMGDGSPSPQPKDWGLTAAFRDVDQDGDPDLYVCNDFQTPDRFWINMGGGRFQYAPPNTQRRMAYFSMGTDFADINRDGQLDFMTLDMLSRSHLRRKTQMGDMVTSSESLIGAIFNQPQIMQNALFLNRGDGTFAEIAQLAHVRASEWSWSSVFMDVDLDGYEDLLVTTGMMRDYMDSDISNQIKTLKPDELKDKNVLEFFPELKTANFIFRNNQKLEFDDMSNKWGFRREAVSGGLASADFDNDGDLDLIINNVGELPELYENKAGAARVLVRLKGDAPNTRAIGAQLRFSGGPVTQVQEIVSGGHYTSSSEPVRMFAASKQGPHSLDVSWPGGGFTTLTNLLPNHIYEIDRKTRSAKDPANVEFSNSEFVVPESMLFEDDSHLLKHFHFESEYDDFKRQSLLPNRLSQLGPGIAWADLDADQDEDLVIGSGRGGKVHVFMNDGGRRFVAHASPNLNHDQTTVLAFHDENGDSMIMTGLSNYEDAPSDLVSAQAFNGSPEKRWQLGPSLPPSSSMTGPMSMADVDGDGDLDLFVGGRTIPGRYPEPASSRLFLNQKGTFEEHSPSSETFKDIGMVSGSVFGDLDRDGDPDLVLAIEWGPIRVFENSDGSFKDITSELGLAASPGWWNSVQLGDFDNDGQLDIVAGNWGLNSKYEHHYSVFKPLQIHYGDFDTNGILDIVEAHYDKEMGTIVPERGRSCSSRAMPFIAERNPTFHVFGSRSLEEVYGSCIQTARVVEANTLSHMVFLNRGDSFKGTQLPLWSQFAPVYGINVADFDGDGNEDLFLAQNFFAVQIETPRMDGGRGLLLIGDGKGGFRSVKGHHSGLLIYGEQRGSAVADYNRDGRPDLVVTQNGSLTRLFKNAAGRPGLRVRLKGHSGNIDAVGAILQMEYADGRRGPARQIATGSGYWSQDSHLQVLPSAGASRLHVLWPGGKASSHPVRPDVREITLSQGDQASIQPKLD